MFTLGSKYIHFKIYAQLMNLSSKTFGLLILQRKKKPVPLHYAWLNGEEGKGKAFKGKGREGKGRKKRGE